MIKTAGIMGYGHFGKFLAELIQRFSPETEVRVYSRSNPVDRETFFPLEDTCESDILLLAVPINSYEATLQKVKPYVSSNTVVVDIATVKDYTAKLLKTVLPDNYFLSIHPMFGPSSYEKRQQDVSGFRIALTDSNLSPMVLDALEDHVTSLGFTVIKMTSEEHDKKLAETLFLTHYIGQVISKGKFERSDIDTVSFGYLMDAVDSVKEDTDLFVDVSLFNPYCAEVIKRFDSSEKFIKDQFLSNLHESNDS